MALAPLFVCRFRPSLPDPRFSRLGFLLLLLRASNLSSVSWLHLCNVLFYSLGARLLGIVVYTAHRQPLHHMEAGFYEIYALVSSREMFSLLFLRYRRVIEVEDRILLLLNCFEIAYTNVAVRRAAPLTGSAMLLAYGMQQYALSKRTQASDFLLPRSKAQCGIVVTRSRRRPITRNWFSILGGQRLAIFAGQVSYISLVHVSIFLS